MSRLICQAQNLNIVYKRSTYHSQNLKDSFISFVKNPIRSIFHEPDRLHILKNISFDVHEGDRIGVMGVNGAGKTTLLRVMAGVVQPTFGNVSIASDIRAVFQNLSALHPELTGFENASLLIGLLFPSLSDEECRKLTEEACEFSELGTALYTPFRTYSTGMQSRLMLSIATARPARLLILDEVFDGADFQWRNKIAQRTKKMIEDSGSLLFVSHNLTILKQVCNKAIVLNGGKSHIFENVEEACDYYQTATVKKS